MKENRIIMGIDPGTVIMGYGLISTDGSQASLVTMGVLKLDKLQDHFARLQKIHDRIASLVKEFQPAELALEAPFYGKNVQSMLKLGRAQGVALSPALEAGIPVFEYAPRRIKQAITGNGNASKEQVSAMVQKILKFNDDPRYLDATDALAVAVCHFFQDSKPASPAGAGSWKDFIRKNPGRVR